MKKWVVIYHCKETDKIVAKEFDEIHSAATLVKEIRERGDQARFMEVRDPTGKLRMKKLDGVTIEKIYKKEK